MRTQIQLYREGRPSTADEVLEALQQDEQRHHLTVLNFTEAQAERERTRKYVRWVNQQHKPPVIQLRPLWRKHWLLIIGSSLIGAALFGLAMMWRAL